MLAVVVNAIRVMVMIVLTVVSHDCWCRSQLFDNDCKDFSIMLKVMPELVPRVGELFLIRQYHHLSYLVQ
jgi:hypothetical protein